MKTMNRAFLILIVSLACTLISCSHSESKNRAIDAEVERSFYLMGTTLDVSLTAQTREDALRASEAVFQSVRSAEYRLSTWIPNSELSRVNQSKPNQEVRLSALLSRDLQNAYRCAKDTEFSFSPWVGPLVQVWGLRKGGRIPSVPERENATRASRPDVFRWTGQGVIKVDSDALIEEGGFGKGIGLDDALDAIRPMSVKSAILNFGGQISLFGTASTSVEISDPSDRQKALLRFEAAQGSISTSGNSEHGIILKEKKGKKRVGHILNPLTGFPADFDGSVTVIAEKGVDADCLSTALFVMGEARGLQWLNKNSIQGMWIKPGRKVGTWIAKVGCAWKPHLEKITDTIDIQRVC